MKILFLLIITAFLLQGCLPFYPAALLGTRMPSIISNPKSKNNEKSKYIGLDASNSPGFNSNEHNLNFRNHFLIAKSTKYRVENVGFFVFGGVYKVGAIDQYEGKYGYFGFGPEVSLALYLLIQFIDIGLGAYCTCAYEAGNYLKFKKKVFKENLADAFTSNWYGFLSLFPIIRAHLNEKISCWFSFIPSINKAYDYSLEIDKYGYFTLGAGYKF
ncbi:MAG: hypothetical protein HQ534_00455 [Armatimonadetes bacterium]|nr:hypothetical protein [Armatimonadota bacterium]